VKYLPLPFYQLNRLRGTYSIFAKVNAVIIGLFFGYVTKNPYVGSAMAIGYLAGESMGWGEWIGGILRNDGQVAARYDGQKNGIQWLATRFTTIDTLAYHKLSLAIRGFYWWFLTLIPLAFVMNPFVVAASILVLAIGFPYSVVKTMDWKKAEYLYGFIQDAVLFPLIGVLYVTN